MRDGYAVEGRMLSGGDWQIALCGFPTREMAEREMARVQLEYSDVQYRVTGEETRR